MLCKRCTVELAEFVGFTDRLTADITISRLADEVTRLESQIQAIPNETENLIDSIRSSVSNFVLSISSKPDNNGNKTVPDSGGSPKSTSGSTKASGGNNKTRPESTSN
jgi:hypothetical protein